MGKKTLTIEGWFKENGINPERDLFQDCADFYLLERMASDGIPRAKNILVGFEQELAREFSAYLGVAISGEIRYFPGEGRGHGDNWKTALGDTPLVEWIHLNHEGGSERDHAWRSFPPFVQEYGIQAVRWVQDAFNLDEWWGGGFGGKKWGAVARVLGDYMEGNIKRRLFLDRCWTLEHNGGCVFNKVYTVERYDKKSGSYSTLQSVLATQAADDYKTLAVRWAGAATQKLWASRTWHLPDQWGVRMLDRDPTWLGYRAVADFPDDLEGF
jgi:hypothetical protein